MRVIRLDVEGNNPHYKTNLCGALESMPEIPGIGQLICGKEDGLNIKVNNKIIETIFHEASRKYNFCAGSGNFLLIDRSTEAGVLKGREDLFNSLSSSTGIPLNKVIYCSQNQLTKLQTGNYPHWVNFHEYAIRMAHAYRDISLGDDLSKIRKLALCLNSKVRPHRIAAVLAVHDAIGQDLLFSWRNNEALFSNKEAFDLFERDFPKTATEYETTLLQKDYRKFDANIDSALGVPIAESEQCFMELVCETDYLSWSNRITEKILKPIVTRRPFVVMGSCGVLRTLRQYGFMTFDGIIDESYDNEPNHQLRLDMIVGEIKRIYAGDINQFASACSFICEYNNSHIRSRLKARLVSQLHADLSKVARDSF
jgi:hypothetical protein